MPDFEGGVALANKEIQAILKIRDDLSAQIQKTNKNLKELNREVKKSQKELEKVSKNTSFKNLTKSIFTAQLAMKAFTVAARGIASAFRASAEFETSMTKLVTLVGLSRDEVKDLEESVKDLAGETAQSPRQLAESLFFIESAGLRGKEAMDALELSAKAAAIGMGEQKDIADALTSAMNAYGPSVLTAQQATDTMLAAVRAGKMEPRELAGALGQVLPVAAEMGVTFQEVNAVLAALSKTGTPVVQGVNQIRSAMMAFLKPGEKAAKILAQYGLSAAKIREQIRERGLVETLISLRETFRGNEEELAKVIGRVEGFNAVLALTGDHAKDTRDVLEQTNNSLGLVDEGFKEVSDTAAHQFNQSMAELEKIGIELASNVLPPIVDLLKEFNAILKSVSPETKEWAIQMGLLAIALAKVAPLLTKLGALKLAKGAFAAGAGGPVAVIAIALGLVTLLESKLKSLDSVQERMSKRDKGIIGTIVGTATDQSGIIKFLKDFTVEAEKVEPAAKSAAKGFNQFANIPVFGAAAESIIPDDLLDKMSDAMKVSQKIIDEYVPKLSEIGHEYGVITIAARPYAKLLLEGKKNTDEATASAKTYAEALEQLSFMTTAFGRTFAGIFGGGASVLGGVSDLFGKDAETGLSGMTRFLGSFKSKTEKGLATTFGSFFKGLAGALPAIGAIVGPAIQGFKALFGAIFKGPDIARDVARDLGPQITQGLEDAIKQSGQPVQLAIAQIFREGFASGTATADMLAGEIGDLFSGFERGEYGKPQLIKALEESVPLLIERLRELGPTGEAELQRIISAAERFGVTFEGLSDLVQNAFAPETMEGIAEAFGISNDQVRELAETLGVQLQTDLERMAATLGLSVDEFRELGKAVQDQFGIPMEQIDELLEAMGVNAEDLAKSLGVDVAGDLEGSMSSANDEVTFGANEAGRLADELERAARAAGGISFSSGGGIPGFATGGYVPANPPHGTLVRVAEKEGEYITPKSQASPVVGGGGASLTIGGMTFNVYGVQSPQQFLEWLESDQGGVKKAIIREMQIAGALPS